MPRQRKPEMTPAQVGAQLAKLNDMVHSRFDLPTLIAGIEADAAPRVKQKNARVAELASNAVEWAGKLREALDRGDATAAATWALKAGAAVERMFLVELLATRWLTPGAVAVGLGVEKWEVTRLVQAQKLRSTGAGKHKRLRIDPLSVLDYCRSAGVVWQDVEAPSSKQEIEEAARAALARKLAGERENGQDDVGDVLSRARREAESWY